MLRIVNKLYLAVLLALTATLTQAQVQTYYPLKELLSTGKTIVGEDIR